MSRTRLGLANTWRVESEAAGFATAYQRGVSATVAAKVFFGALDEMATNWILSRREYALAGDADAVVDLFLHGLQAPRERPRAGTPRTSPPASQA